MPEDPTASSDVTPPFESRFRARSYELDGFAHVNHAVFLNWLEQARFEALEAGGHPMNGLAEKGWAVVVVRVEIDFEKEVLLGDEVVVRTRAAETRKTSMTLEQRVFRISGGGREEGGEEVLAARARVVAVWLREGRPQRIPTEVLKALGVG